MTAIATMITRLTVLLRLSTIILSRLRKKRVCAEVGVLRGMMNGNSLAEDESGVLDQGLESVRTAPAAPRRLAGDSAPWVGHVLRVAGGSVGGTSRFAIRIRW